MTSVINLYGGPGIGKSSTAAELFVALKKREINCELVREYVKDWAWEKREIKPFDQFYFFGKQVRKESMLFDKVDMIVTDSPVLLGGVFAEEFGTAEIKSIFPSLIVSYYNACKDEQVNHLHFLLKRVKPYNPNGRYQTKQQAVEFDSKIEQYFKTTLSDQLIEVESVQDILTYLDYTQSRK